MTRPRSSPPTEWCAYPLRQLGPEMYYGWPDTGERTPRVWHWCDALDAWICQGTRLHTLVRREPLHLEPSLDFPCCALHGFVRDGSYAPV